MTSYEIIRKERNLLLVAAAFSFCGVGVFVWLAATVAFGAIIVVILSACAGTICLMLASGSHAQMINTKNDAEKRES